MKRINLFRIRTSVKDCVAVSCWLKEISPGLLSSAHYLSIQPHLQRLSRFQPFVLLALRLHYSNLSQAQRFDSLRPAPRTNPPDFRNVHEHPPTRFRDERHGAEDRSVLTVF